MCIVFVNIVLLSLLLGGCGEDDIVLVVIVYIVVAAVIAVLQLFLLFLMVLVMVEEAAVGSVCGNDADAVMVVSVIVGGGVAVSCFIKDSNHTDCVVFFALLPGPPFLFLLFISTCKMVCLYADTFGLPV